MLALLQQPQNLGRTLLLASFTRSCNDLQVDLILTHESNRQASEDSTQEHQGNGNAQVDP
jgi:hypothetical protein